MLSQQRGACCRWCSVETVSALRAETATQPLLWGAALSLLNHTEICTMPMFPWREKSTNPTLVSPPSPRRSRKRRAWPFSVFKLLVPQPMHNYQNPNPPGFILFLKDYFKGNVPELLRIAQAETMLQRLSCLEPP